MKKILISLFLFSSLLLVNAQDFFRGNISPEKKYIVLTNPTVGNLKIILFLLEHKLLDIDTSKIHFVGVYHSGQAYDFSKTAVYIRDQKIPGFYLHAISSDLREDDIFRENLCTYDLLIAFRNSLGVFFFGGPDIPPSVYGEENLYSTTNDPVRHYFETTFLFHLLGGNRNTSFAPFLDENTGYIVTGFCLGMQTMNVAAGGTLYQDIPAQIYNSTDAASVLAIGRNNLHKNYFSGPVNDSTVLGINIHPVNFTDHVFFGTTVSVRKKIKPLIYSSHHQSVKDLGQGLSVTALSADGKVIEGIAHTRFPNVFAVQFHPEVSALYENMEPARLEPGQKLRTLHRMIGRKSLGFHEKYWEYISSVIRSEKIKAGN